jgi:hypothetical protein
MRSIEGNLNHARISSAGTKYMRVVDGELREFEKPAIAECKPLFPYHSDVFPTVDIEDRQKVKDDFALRGIFVDFDEEGRFEVTSSEQHSKIATELGMKTGRDGYGHVDDEGNFHNSGRRKHEEDAVKKAQTQAAMDELNQMPIGASDSAIDGVLEKHGIDSINAGSI